MYTFTCIHEQSLKVVDTRYFPVSDFFSHGYGGGLLAARFCLFFCDLNLGNIYDLADYGGASSEYLWSSPTCSVSAPYDTWPTLPIAGLDSTYILFSRTNTMVKAPMMTEDKKPLSKFGASADQKTRGHQARKASCSCHQRSEQIMN